MYTVQMHASIFFLALHVERLVVLEAVVVARGSSSLYGSGIHEESVSDTETIRQMNKSRPPSRKNIIMEQLALAT